MNGKRKNWTLLITLVGGLFLAGILIGGTMMMGRSAERDAVGAARSVSLLYLDELASRRGRVVEDKLKDNISLINIAVGLMTDEDLSDLEHMSAYQRRMKRLFSLERFAFVDEAGLVYTADEGVREDADQYAFDHRTLSQPEISVRNPRSANKRVVIAVPIRERGFAFGGQRLDVCFMEIDMNVMLQGVSMTTQSSGSTFSNIYTAEGVALTDSILGGLAQEDNLLEALASAEYEPGYSLEMVTRAFSEGQKGVVSFTYKGIQETLSYVPITGTDWMMTYLVRDSVISDRISRVTGGVVRRSLIQSGLTALVMAAMFGFLIAQNRKNAKLALEKETAEAENRVKRAEMERRLALKEQLLEQQAKREQQAKMITALASDYRSVYFLELSQDQGVCYQARKDLPGFHEEERFPYLQSVTDYCNRYVLPAYREKFLRFIRPEAIREGLKAQPVISYQYMISVSGKESYEAVRFARVQDAGEENGLYYVGACFADVDAETRETLARNQALSDALAAAEQASRAKTVFLSNMSHEIRTPMNAIIGLNNIALNEPDVPDKVREYLGKIGVSAQHLLEIINDILDMSRIESGRMVIKSEEFSFAKSLEQVNTIISGQCRDKGLQYDCRTVGRIDEYYIGDEMKLKQVMINILGNAVKFTPEGGTVTFLIEEGQRFDGKAVLKMTIRDTGIGMSADYLPHLFETFSQEDSTATSKYGSTGLGMPITKSIVELMNGHIDVESEKGKGTTFTVTVTLGESDRRHTLMDENDLDPGEMNVLVIDDDPIALEHAQIVLGKIGVSCEVAASGAEGLEMVKLRHARRADYHLILVDWRMPEMDGVETTRRIRALVGQDTPIIILTSYNWDDVAEEATRAGVNSFVPKPLFAGSVLDQFREAYRRNQSMRQRADLKGRRVLLAEDVPVNAEIMVMLLSMREMEVDTAENGRIAVEQYTSHPAGYYDAILMDMRMPEMDGLEATRRIRESGREDAAEIPIIALTANAFDEDVQRSMQAGLNAHLAKPVEPDVLFDTLETLIRH